MKIDRVEAFQMDWGSRRSAWVRIWTDDGLYGLGEASPMEGGRASLEIITGTFASVLRGANPLDIRVLQDRLFHRGVKLGPDGALAGALAAVDIALWDLKGKILGQPIYQLLGGAWRTKLPFYASIGGNAYRSLDDVLRVVEGWLPLKPALIKIRLDADRTTRDLDIPGDIAKIRAVRKLLGDDYPLSFDPNNNYSVQGAIRVGRVLEELGCQWFEEPVQHYHVESFEKVAAALDIPIAAGEQEYTLQGVQRLIDAGVSIIQADIVKTGGFTGLQDMAALTRTHGVDFVPHQTQPSVGQMASLQFSSTLLHSHYPCEYDDKSGIQDVVFTDPVRPVEGLFTLPDLPGLGLTVIEEELAKRMHMWGAA
jgi:L-alanine-DL-glutamate epimerase-like enolase superfamily enzyme